MQPAARIVDRTWILFVRPFLDSAKRVPPECASIAHECPACVSPERTRVGPADVRLASFRANAARWLSMQAWRGSCWCPWVGGSNTMSLQASSTVEVAESRAKVLVVDDD